MQLGVYAVNGARVAILVDELLPEGHHEVIWTGLNEHGQRVASGTYFYRLRAGDFNETRRMMLLK